MTKQHLEFSDQVLDEISAKFDQGDDDGALWLLMLELERTGRIDDHPTIQLRLAMARLHLAVAKEFEPMLIRIGEILLKVIRRLPKWVQNLFR